MLTGKVLRGDQRGGARSIMLDRSEPGRRDCRQKSRAEQQGSTQDKGNSAGFEVETFPGAVPLVVGDLDAVFKNGTRAWLG